MFLLLGGDLESVSARRPLGGGEGEPGEYLRFRGAGLIEGLFLRTLRLGDGERDKLSFRRGVGDLDALNDRPLRRGGLRETELLRVAFLGGVTDRVKLLLLPRPLSTALPLRGGVLDNDRSRFIPLFLGGVGDLEYEDPVYEE